MCALIEANLETLNIDENEIEVVSVAAIDFLRRRANKGAAPFDIIFFDPPYATDYEAVLNYVGGGATGLLTAKALVIAEHDRKNDLREEFGGLKRYRVLKQGDSSLSFYEAT